MSQLDLSAVFAPFGRNWSLPSCGRLLARVKRILTKPAYSSGMPPQAAHKLSSIAWGIQNANGSHRVFSYRASWLVIACGFPVALLTLAASGIGIAAMSVAPLICLAAMLLAVEIYFTRYRNDEMIVATCGMLAVLIAASLLAAVISHSSLRLGFPYVDGSLSKADLALGIHAPAIVLEIAEHPIFAKLLEVLYSSAFPICIFCSLILAASGRREMAREFAFCFTFCILLASVTSIFFPALGSTVHHGIEGIAGLPIMAGNFHMATVEHFRNDPLATFDLAKVQGIVTFPSFHMVMALLVPYAVRGTTLLAAIATCWASLLMLSTVVIGGHYFVDLLGGAATWATALWWLGRLDCKC